MTIKSARQAFTLIELLVVVAIIALLAAILFPVFSRIRENARRTSCQSNLKQLGLGFIQYSQDFDERLPIGYNVKPAVDYPADNRGGWAGQLFPYVRSTQIFTCPSERKGTVSYGYNQCIAFTTSNSQGAIGKSQLNQFSQPTKTVMLFEVTGVSISQARLEMSDEGLSLPANQVAYSSSYSPIGSGFGSSEPNGLYGNGGTSGGNGKYATGNIGGRNLTGTTNGIGVQPVTGRHLDGSNFLAADGHVKWLGNDAVSTGLTPPTSSTPQGATIFGAYINGGAAGTQSMMNGPQETQLTFSPL